MHAARLLLWVYTCMHAANFSLHFQFRTLCLNKINKQTLSAAYNSIVNITIMKKSGDNVYRVIAFT